jgi:hypothetical protein
MFMHQLIKHCFLIIVTGFSFSVSGQNSSVLSSGQWARLGVTNKGIYKIDRQVLSEAGFAVGSLDANKIRLFGHGGGMLPQSNAVEQPDDLLENAIYAEGLEDGSFDQNDYILFYAEGPKLEYVDHDGKFIYQQNLYADTSYYFITVGENNGKRMENLPNLGSGLPVINSYTHYMYHELDRVNILSSGRAWFGQFMTASNPIRIEFENMPQVLAGTEITMVSTVVNRSQDPGRFNYNINGTPVGSIEASGIGPGTYDDKGVIVTDTLHISASQLDNQQGNMNVVIIYRGAGNGLLDYLTVSYESPLEMIGQSAMFRSPSSQENISSTFKISNANSNVVIWDVTDPQSVGVQEYNLEADQAVFGANSSTLHEYLAFQGNDFPLPVSVESLASQNLHGLSVPDLLIVTHSLFLDQALQLAAFRSEHDEIEVAVVTTDEVYNEFSSGRQDITAIRNFVKYLYRKDDKLKYLLLFGRSSFDYKNITEGNTNFVPTYQSRNSVDPIYSYNSDDYFGFLDDDEGMWTEELSGAGGHLLDIAVGRLPVTSRQEAQDVVNKLIHYASNPITLGSWKQDIYYLADDGDFNLHQRDADQLATMVDTSSAAFNVHKIYMDAFPQEQTPNGESADAVNFALEEAIKKGALIINYTGHGSEFRWAEETILNHNMINSWENLDRLPFFVTATCEFGRHDDPKRISGAEKLITNPKGGAIGLVTTARPVFASKNFILNQAFYEVALTKTDTGYPTLGEIFKYTKNDSYNILANRNFALLGDPSMKLAYPKEQLQITDIISDNVPGDTVKALSAIKITGAVVDQKGEPLTNYDGTAEITVFDKQTDRETLGSDGGRTFSFKERNSVIFRGQASIKSGIFEVNFIVPKNINYIHGSGKISLYALSTNNLGDASGASNSFIIGGTNKNAPIDNTPPEIALYMDDLSFVSGGSTGESTLLLARLTDESGINISNSGLGQDIVLEIDSEQEIILNDFFTADIDSYQSGWVRYPMDGLQEGEHTLSLEAWDIHNNSSVSSLEFIVFDGAGLSIGEVKNYPNPVKDFTTFLIDHNQPGSDLEVTIVIFDQQGKLVHQISTKYPNSPSTINDVTWNGTNGQGTPLKNGIYLYQVIVKSTTSGDINVENQKMILIK